MKSKITLIAVLVLMVLAFFVVIQNRGPVGLRFLFWPFELPIAILAFAMFVLGFVGGVFVSVKMKGAK